MKNRNARITMLIKVRITAMLTILGTYNIETLEEFNHADPDDYGSMYQALGHLYKVSGTINEEDRIATHVERDLASEFEPSARRAFLNLYAWEDARYTDNIPIEDQGIRCSCGQFHGPEGHDDEETDNDPAF